MRTVPAATQGWCEGHYVTALEAGWVALTDPVREAGFGLVFPRDVFPSCGAGWSTAAGAAIHHVALEPLDGLASPAGSRGGRWPSPNASAGRRRSNARRSAVPYHGFRSVGHIDQNGMVHA